MPDLKPTLKMPYFCPACQAIPQAGYCHLAGCPTAPTDLKPTLTDEEAEKATREQVLAKAKVIDPDAWEPFSTEDIFRLADRRVNSILKARAWLASPGPALRGEGGKGVLALIANVRANTSLTPDEDEGGNATLATLDADLLETVLSRLSYGLDLEAGRWKADAILSSAGQAPSLPPDVKAAVERLTAYCGWCEGSDHDRLNEYVANDGYSADFRTLLASHTALTEANGRMRAGLEQAALELQEAANLLRPKYPSTANIFAAASVRAAALITVEETA